MVPEEAGQGKEACGLIPQDCRLVHLPDQISYRRRMQSHDCYCFLPMTSLLVQPYHPRKDAIKIFGIGLNDVALQVSNIILWKKKKIASCSCAAVVEQSFCWKRKRHIFSASRGFAGAEAACWLCADLPAGISSRNAARWSFITKEGPLFLVLSNGSFGCLRNSAFTWAAIIIQSGRESSNSALLASLAFFFPPGCLKEVAVVTNLIKEWGLTCLRG